PALCSAVRSCGYVRAGRYDHHFQRRVPSADPWVEARSGEWQEASYAATRTANGDAYTDSDAHADDGADVHAYTNRNAYTHVYTYAYYYTDRCAHGDSADSDGYTVNAADRNTNRATYT